MYRIYDTKNLVEFENYAQLINYISSFNRFDGTEFYNSFLDRTGNNPNDLFLSYIPYPYCLPVLGYNYETRCYLEYRSNRIYDDDWNSIYDSLLVKDVRNWTYRDDIYKQWREFTKKRREPTKWERKYAKYTRHYPEFRKGPWPDIHNRHRYSCSYRSPRLFNERKNTAYREMEPFNRPSRGKNLPDPWDEEPMRDWRNKGWKRQGKRRHQWENGVICREQHEYGKGAYVHKDRSKDLSDADS